MSEHLDMIKQAASTHVDNLIEIVRNEHGFDANKNSQLCACITSLRRDHATVADEMVNITRVFVLTEDSTSYAGVGWVVSSEVRNCMRCTATFGIFNPRHHCRACGDVVCSLCLPHRAQVVDIMEMGPLKVCTNCCDGLKVRFYKSSLVGTLMLRYLQVLCFYNHRWS